MFLNHFIIGILMKKIKSVPVYKHDSKNWDCSHIDKEDIVVITPTEAYLYNTDYPEPEHPYYYIFLYHIEGVRSKRSIRCNCPKSCL
jgi:hypothetical protein